jgi:hypothetical protein
VGNPGHPAIGTGATGTGGLGVAAAGGSARPTDPLTGGPYPGIVIVNVPLVWPAQPV